MGSFITANQRGCPASCKRFQRTGYSNEQVTGQWKPKDTGTRHFKAFLLVWVCEEQNLASLAMPKFCWMTCKQCLPLPLHAWTHLTCQWKSFLLMNLPQKGKKWPWPQRGEIGKSERQIQKKSIKRSKNTSQESHISHVHYSSKRRLPNENIYN